MSFLRESLPRSCKVCCCSSPGAGLHFVTLWRKLRDLAIRRRNQCDAGNAGSEQLWNSPLGRQVLTLETAAITPFIRRLHGDVVLWAGSHVPSADMLQRCMVRHSLFLQPRPELGPSTMASLAGQLEALPFKSNSLDGVVLHHALEETSDQRVALREVTRVVVPGGRLIICGFNPLSVLGVRRLYARVARDGLSDHHFVNPLRMFDWLPLLGFELDVAPLYCGYLLPFRKLMERFDLPMLERREHALYPKPMLPFGSVLVVSAIKQAVSSRRQWRGKKEHRRLAPVAYPSVSSWQRIEP